MFVKPHNHKSVAHMYSDLKNLHLIVGDDSFVKNYLNGVNAKTGENLILIGHHDWTDGSLASFERHFYRQHGVPFDNKWSSFFCRRDEKNESRVFDSLAPSEDYIFVHDDGRFRLDPSRLPSGIRVVRPDMKEPDIFNYAKLIENAKSVHCIESSFAFMIDAMNLNPNHTIHRYARYQGDPKQLGYSNIPDYRYVKEILE